MSQTPTTDLVDWDKHGDDWISASAHEATRQAAKHVIVGRKTWKVRKEDAAPVWPPGVEGALIEGLEKYRPRSKGDTKLLRRFPKRNRWISDYIFERAHERRTAKQVGSRLQQLRDTCKDQRILDLISRREYSPEPEPDVAMPLSSFPEHPSHNTSLTVDTAASGQNSIQRIMQTTGLRRVPDIRRHQLNQAVPRRPISRRRIPFNPDADPNIPIVAFTSETSIDISTMLVSKYKVFLKDNLIHREATSFHLISNPDKDKGRSLYTYGTPWIPGYFSMLIKKHNLEEYRVTQEIMSSRKKGYLVKNMTFIFDFRPAVSENLDPANFNSPSPSASALSYTTSNSSYSAPPTPLTTPATSPFSEASFAVSHDADYYKVCNQLSYQPYANATVYAAGALGLSQEDCALLMGLDMGLDTSMFINPPEQLQPVWDNSSIDLDNLFFREQTLPLPQSEYSGAVQQVAIPNQNMYTTMPYQQPQINADANLYDMFLR